MSRSAREESHEVRRPARDEAGFSAVEVMIASVVALVVLSMASVSTVVLTRSAVRAVQSGSSTGPAMLAEQEVQQAISGAWNPADTLPAGSSEQCTQLVDGQTQGQSFPSGQGPFVSATSTNVEFCGFANGSNTAYTYDLHFASGSCTSSGLCTLELDQLLPSCTSSCTTILWRTGDVSDSGTPFAFYDTSGTSWATTSTLSSIQAVQVTLTVSNPAFGGTSTDTVQRTVLMPNVLSAGGS